MTISKTREGAKVPSREAIYLQFDNTNLPPDVMGVRPIGGPNVDASLKGVQYPNIQNAIDELRASSTEIQINGIYTSTENTPPQGKQQTERLTFSGVVTGAEGATKSIIHVYGIPFVVEVGTNADQVCATVLAKFTEMVNNNQIFSYVQRTSGTSTPILELKFIDNCAHANTGDFNENGISIVREVTSPGVSGYGTWTLLGTEPKFGIDLYYFKRIG